MHVTACAIAHVLITPRDRWGNAQMNRVGGLLGIIVGGGAANGSAASLQETIIVPIATSRADFALRKV